MADAKALFETVQSIHLYSLQPSPLTDLHALTDVARDITTIYAKEDPLEYGKMYGVIQNKNVKVIHCHPLDRTTKLLFLATFWTKTSNTNDGTSKRTSASSSVINFLKS